MTNIAQLIIVLLLGIGAGYFAGHKDIRLPHTPLTNEKKPLYYRHPMNPQVTSPTPAKDEMGMDFVAVYTEQTQANQTDKPTQKIRYYRHPMGAADNSPVPKKDEMGMDYLPVYEAEQMAEGQIQISPEKIQKLGVTSTQVSLRPLTATIRALGSVQVDESRIHTVTPRFEGWIQHLYINKTGQAVKQGQPLFDLYSPELSSAEQEYLIARQGQHTLQSASAQAQATARQIAENALLRLRNYQLSNQQLQQLQNSGKENTTLQLQAPVSGIVLDKPAVEGMRFMPGDALYKIADISRVWLIAEVFEQDLAIIQLGSTAHLQINAYPEQSFIGKVAFIYPTLTPETRTAKVRIELPNPQGLLKPGLYGSVSLTQPAQASQIAIPDSTVIDTGKQQIVLLDKGEGHFQPQIVQLGQKVEGYYAVLQGLQVGDKIVTRANFLLDAESRLKSALTAFDNPSADTEQKATAKPVAEAP